MNIRYMKEIVENNNHLCIDYKIENIEFIVMSALNLIKLKNVRPF